VEATLRDEGWLGCVWVNERTGAEVTVRDVGVGIGSSLFFKKEKIGTGFNKRDDRVHNKEDEEGADEENEDTDIQNATVV
jgi:hypothetical protein